MLLLRTLHLPIPTPLFTDPSTHHPISLYPTAPAPPGLDGGGGGGGWGSHLFCKHQAWYLLWFIPGCLIAPSPLRLSFCAVVHRRTSTSRTFLPSLQRCILLSPSSDLFLASRLINHRLPRAQRQRNKRHPSLEVVLHRGQWTPTTPANGRPVRTLSLQTEKTDGQ